MPPTSTASRAARVPSRRPRSAGALQLSFFPPSEAEPVVARPRTTQPELCMLPIDEIFVPRHRMRQDLGNLRPLKRSLTTTGLIQPLTVDDHNCLVAGERRLTSLKELGWTHVPVIRRPFTPELRRLVELEENLHRKNFSALEFAKAVAEFHELKVQIHGQNKGGRPSKKTPTDKNPGPRVMGFPDHNGTWDLEHTAKLLGKSGRYVARCVNFANVIKVYPALEEIFRSWGPDVTDDVVKRLSKATKSTQDTIAELVMATAQNPPQVDPEEFRDYIQDLIEYAISKQACQAQLIKTVYTSKLTASHLIAKWKHLQRAFANLWAMTPPEHRAEVLDLFTTDPLLAHCTQCAHFQTAHPLVPITHLTAGAYSSRTPEPSPAACPPIRQPARPRSHSALTEVQS